MSGWESAAAAKDGDVARWAEECPSLALTSGAGPDPIGDVHAGIIPTRAGKQVSSTALPDRPGPARRRVPFPPPG